MNDPARRLADLEHGTTTADALTLFDALPPVTLDEMTGSWRGRGVPTGHPLDGMLEHFGWHGKRIDSSEDVHPLVFNAGDGALLAIDPARLPIAIAIRASSLVNTPVAARLFRLAHPLLRTRKPAARLRMTEHRDVLTATMLYDALPINDVFRKVDDDTLLGVMDMRGTERPFFFSLRREPIQGS